MASAFQQVNSIGGEGTFSLNRTPRIVAATKELGIEDTLLDAGGPDHNRATLRFAEPIKLSRGRYLGISPEQARHSYGFLGDRQRAAEQRDSRLSTDTAISDAHIGAAQAIGLDSPFCIWIYSYNSGHTSASEERLEYLEGHLADEVRLGYTVLPREQYLRDRIREDPDFPVRLVERGLLECSVLQDDRSAIASRYGRPHQDQLVAKALASVMAAVHHFPNQRSPADVTHALADYGALVGLSFGSRHLRVGPEVWWWKPLPWLGSGSPKGRGSQEDVITQTRAAAQDALTDPQWRSIDEDVDRHKQAFLTLTLPLKLNDPRWAPLAADIDQWLHNEHPYVTTLWVSGSGTPEPQLSANSPYWVQASLFYPLPDRPRATQKILDQDSLQRRNHDRGVSNGHVDRQVAGDAVLLTAGPSSSDRGR